MLDHISHQRLQALVSVLVLFLVAIAGWQLLHCSSAIPSELYPYLYSLPPEMVVKAQTEGRELGQGGWAAVLAIRSTLPESEVGLIMQLRKGRSFQDLDWGGIRPEQVKLAQDRCSLLLKYPYFEPNRFTFPVRGKYWYEDSFGADREGGKRKHEGTDLFGAEGTPLISVSAGKVEQLGWNRLGGERVGVRGDDGNYYYYAHLQMISPQLKKGRRVEKGEAIGTMGHSGDALTTPDHLHFGIELHNGTWVNPYPLLKVWERQAANAKDVANRV